MTAGEWGKLAELIGGPQDGLVVVSTGRIPLVMLDPPREKMFTDTVTVSAYWNENLRWYEVPRDP